MLGKVLEFDLFLFELTLLMGQKIDAPEFGAAHVCKLISAFVIRYM